MHGICQGTMPISMYLVLEALQAAGCKSWSAMGEYFGFWVLPNAYKSCNYLFAKKRLEAHRKSGRIKAPASEILTIYQFYNISARPLGPKPLARWLARLSFPNAISLTRWSACPMEAFQDASWTKQPKYATSCLMKLGGLHTKSKKNHWMMHYGDSLEEHGASFLLLPREEAQGDSDCSQRCQQLIKVRSFSLQGNLCKAAACSSVSFTKQHCTDFQLQAYSSSSDLFALLWFDSTWGKLLCLSLLPFFRWVCVQR